MDTTDGDDQGGQKGVLALETKSVQPFATKDEYLYAMKEDLAEWFNTLYGLELIVDNFFEQLETGVIMCQHANNVTSFIKEQMEKKGEKKPRNGARGLGILHLPDKGVQYRSQVKAGSFQSRDNVSNFIGWCKALGINNVILFETEDLVLRKNERNVVLCLLEVARRGAEYGMLAPKLVEMEQEIDAEIAGEEPPPQPQRKTINLMSLDETVREMVGRCTCPSQFPMYKISDGKYKIGDSGSLIFVRILRNHVMVRVGGGWDTLENYLCRHDPCRCQTKGPPAKSSFTVVKTPTRATTPSSSLTPLEVRRRTSTPSGDTAKNTTPERSRTPVSQTGSKRSQRSQSLTPLQLPSSESQRRSSTTPGQLLNKSLDTSTISSLRTSQPTRKTSTATVSKSTDYSIPKDPPTDTASDASSSCGGSPSLHKRFNSASDLTFPKEMTLASTNESSLPRPRPVSARSRRTPTGNASSSAGAKTDLNTGRGRGPQKSSNLTPTPARQVRSRSVEPMELNANRTARRVNNNNNNRPYTPTSNNKRLEKTSSVASSRQSPSRTYVGFTPGKSQNAWDADTDDSRSVSSWHSSSTSSSISGTNGHTNGYLSAASSDEPKRPRTPKVNISPDRILPDKPKIISRSHTADLAHLGERGSSPESEASTDVRSYTRMSQSSNQSSTLSLASSFDDYPEAPPEDESLNAQMERLFEEYRRQEIDKQKKQPKGRHRRSNSADLLEMDDSMHDRQRVQNSFQKANSSSRDLLHESGSRRVRSRRSSATSVEGNGTSSTWQMASARRSITPTPTRTSSLRGALGMSRELRNKLNEQSGGGNRSTPSQQVRRSTTPQNIQHSGSVNRGRTPRTTGVQDAGVHRGRSTSYDPCKETSRPSSRVGSRAGSRTGSRNPSRDSSLSRVRPASAMGQREYENRPTPHRPQSARQKTRTSREDLLDDQPCAMVKQRSNSTTCLYPESYYQDQGLLELQLDINDLDLQNKPKPRKDKRDGRTRIPMPVDMLGRQKYDEADAPLKRYDSGVDINNMSPTESSVHGDDAWQQELLGVSGEDTLDNNCYPMSTAQTNGHASHDYTF